MKFSTGLNGTKIAQSCPKLSPTAGETPVPQTLADLEMRLISDPAKSYQKFGPTIRLLEHYCEKSAADIKIADLSQKLTIRGFRPFLRNKTNYTRTSVNTHVTRYTTLRKYASECGFHKEIPQPWQKLHALAKLNGCLDFADFFAATTETPKDVTVVAVKEFTRKQAEAKIRGLRAAVNLQNRFLKMLRQADFTEQQPLATARDRKIGIRLDNLPFPLQTQAKNLLSELLNGTQVKDVSQSWSAQPWDTPTQADLKREEGNGTRRENTVKNVEQSISLLAGYVLDICKQNESDYNTMEKLIAEDPVRSFRNYSLRVRLKGGDSVRNPLACLFAAIRRSPQFKHIDLSWADKLLDEIPSTPQAERDKRKEERYLSLAELEAIPDQILADRKREEARKREAEANEQRLANIRGGHRVRNAEQGLRYFVRNIFRLAMAEFIFRFLIVWPWRGSNLCNCRISGDSPNLFKGPVKRTASLQIPPYVTEALAKDPNAEFWQVYISAQEHKTGRKTGKDIHAILPSLIVAPLDEYLSYREEYLRVIGIDDPGTLLINEEGNRLRLQSFLWLVKDFALYYGGAPTNPHMFRDAVSDECMINHPHDSEHVAKGLMHSTDRTMKRSYAGRHNASVGANTLDAQARSRREKYAKNGLSHEKVPVQSHSPSR
jgi:hypothetical protein